ncbi:MAG: hypothetical protein HYZ18_15340 [Pseudogulbenkiania sp.]|nr:hypothetical protein [Pseudogulbenkiania sp.]
MLLPVAGFVVGWLDLRFGQHVEAGNDLLNGGNLTCSNPFSRCRAPFG